MFEDGRFGVCVDRRQRPPRCPRPDAVWQIVKRTSDGRYQAIADEGEGGFDSSKAATFLESVYTPTFTPEEDGP